MPAFEVKYPDGRALTVKARVRQNIVLSGSEPDWMPGLVIEPADAGGDPFLAEYLAYHVNEGWGFMVADQGQCASYPDEPGFSWRYIP